MKRMLKLFLLICLSLSLGGITRPDSAFAEKSKKVVKKNVKTTAKTKQAKPYVSKNTSSEVATSTSSTTITTITLPQSADTESKKDDKPRSDSLKGVFSNTSDTKSPLNIKSDTLELNSKDHIFIYKGNVELTRDDMKVNSKRLEGRYDEENRMQTVLCIGDVVITKGPSIKATSNRALYKVASSIVELTEGPELYRDGNILIADKVTIFLNEERSEAEGNVRVKVTKTSDQPLTGAQ